jgi:uncharacterized small protein (DUF1192 family)
MPICFSPSGNAQDAACLPFFATGAFRQAECRVGQEALTWRHIRATMALMDFEDASPRARPGGLIAQLAREDLDPLSVAELDERIIALTAEIERTRGKRERAVNHKASAEALFRK